MNPVARWFINTGMRSKTITLYLDKGPFRKALGIPGEDTITILLLNKKGEIVWREEGPCNVDKAKNLSDFINFFFSR